MTPTPPEHETVVTETQARQGRKGRPVLYVLIAGLILAGLAFVIVNGLAYTDAFEPDASDPDRNAVETTN